MPFKLVAIHDAPSGCELELAGNSRITLNVTHATVRDYVILDGFRDLQSFVDAKRIDVYYQPVAISATDWTLYSRLVRESGVCCSVPNVSSLFDLTHSEILALPNRLYGGIGCAVDDLSPVFYTSPIADFLPDNHRGAGWFRWAFSSAGYMLHQIYVNPDSGSVDIHSGHVEHHYLEDSRVT
ncbi:hypothetical protein [Novipirellula caenicola]|uniref:Uncharacterized protein n=1 Tax=Novipirellula caenicola TaxID=1536901 RepID=A0ABP9VXA6_9BACT